ncbi:MAG: hypothetical protein ACLTOX_06695 [Streptococcus thermophilus]
MDAKAADFDTSALTAQVASVQEPANEPVAEEVPAEQADVAETAEGAVTEQASSESHLERQPSQKHLRNN